jgi:flagellar biosynthetic protein FliO
MISRFLVACMCVLCLVGSERGLAHAKSRKPVVSPAAHVVTPDQGGTAAPLAAGTGEQRTALRSESAIVPEYRLTTEEQGSSLAWDTARMGLSLVVVLVLLAVGVKVIRRWPGLTSRDTSAGALQVLGRLPLTAKEAICLIRVGSDALVVGVSPAGISLLHRLEGGVAEATRPLAGGTGERREAYSGSRLRELTAKIRDVQAAWGLGHTDPRGDR